MVKLVDSDQLLERYPAFRGSGKKKGKGSYRLDWLIRSRQIPCVKIGGQIYFDVDAIDAWLRENALGGDGDGS